MGCENIERIKMNGHMNTVFHQLLEIDPNAIGMLAAKIKQDDKTKTSCSVEKYLLWNSWFFMKIQGLYSPFHHLRIAGIG